MSTSTARTRATRSAGVVLLSLLLAAVFLPAGGAGAQTPPSVRLIRASQNAKLYRFGEHVPLNLGVWVGATGGDFVVKARKPAYDQPIAAAQIDPATGRTVRPIPPELVNDWNGLRSFLKVTIRNRRGEVVTTRRVDWCPNSYRRQRLGDGGPDRPRYPRTECYEGFPFTRGMIWGLENEWATSPLAGGDFFDEGGVAVRLPEGRYSFTVRITNAWGDLLDIPKAHRVTTVEAVVEQAEDDDDWEEPMFGSDAGMMRQQSVPTVRNPDPATLPDLVALPAWAIGIERRKGKDLLGFAATPWNRGPGPMVIEGFRRPDSDIMDAFQYFYDADGKVVGRAPAGKLKYHDARGHNHWHFLQFASFDLLDASRDQVVRSRKQGFCLVPTDPVDLTVRGADLTTEAGDLHTECGGQNALWVREVLQAGWGDTYYQGIAGQAFDVSDLPNGRYYVRVTVNPNGKIRDANPNNDVALRKVKLGGSPGRRTVTVSPWKGVDG